MKTYEEADSKYSKEVGINNCYGGKCEDHL